MMLQPWGLCMDLALNLLAQECFEVAAAAQCTA